MGTVQVTYKLLPTDAGVKLDSIKEKLKAIPEVKKVEDDPIGFGLVAIKAVAFVDEAEGATDKMEEKLGSIEGIGDVQVVDLTRL